MDSSKRLPRLGSRVSGAAVGAVRALLDTQAWRMFRSRCRSRGVGGLSMVRVKQDNFLVLYDLQVQQVANIERLQEVFHLANAHFS